MKILKEFKEFAVRGNVLDLAVGVIIGGAFGKIVTSMVNDIIMPPIGKLLGGLPLADMYYSFDTDKVPEGATAAHTLETARKYGQAVIAYGNFINVVLDFTIVAFCVFLIVKGANALRRFQLKEPEVEPPAPTEKECPFCLSKIPVKATRCGHCTSHLKDESDELEGGFA
ncbi:large conductance mechanosensitive channel protein MscL [Paenibacillus solisilvae]|uniref:Large-conductance mechanosensitive channel n=1 Tax=Paenibacillus solisilvae TaxID=2486751 RepID=A0ABW0W110_9BACL